MQAMEARSLSCVLKILLTDTHAISPASPSLQSCTIHALMHVYLCAYITYILIFSLSIYTEAYKHVFAMCVYVYMDVAAQYMSPRQFSTQ